MQGNIYSICISPERGQLKKEVPEVTITELGIENDGHAGDWGRQVTCLSLSSVQRVNKDKNMNIGPGEFAENILIEGIDLREVELGAKLRLGSDVMLQVSQIGKEDHPSVVSRTLGVSLLPYEGLFCRVINGGHIRKGDPVEVIQCTE